MSTNKNLNPWWALIYRWVYNWIRSHLPVRVKQPLWDEKRKLACKDVLIESERKRLGELNRLLGNASIYRLTPKQQRQASKIVAEIVARIEKGRVS